MTGIGDITVRQADTVPVFVEHAFLLSQPLGTTKTSTDKCLGVNCAPGTWVNLAGARQCRELARPLEAKLGSDTASRPACCSKAQEPH